MMQEAAEDGAGGGNVSQHLARLQGHYSIRRTLGYTGIASSYPNAILKEAARRETKQPALFEF